MPPLPWPLPLPLVLLVLPEGWLPPPPPPPLLPVDCFRRRALRNRPLPLPGEASPIIVIVDVIIGHYRHWSLPMVINIIITEQQLIFYRSSPVIIPKLSSVQAIPARSNNYRLIIISSITN